MRSSVVNWARASRSRQSATTCDEDLHTALLDALRVGICLAARAGVLVIGHSAMSTMFGRHATRALALDELAGLHAYHGRVGTPSASSARRLDRFASRHTRQRNRLPPNLEAIGRLAAPFERAAPEAEPCHIVWPERADD